MTESGNYGDSVYESGDPVDDTDDLDPVENLTGDDPDEAMQTGYNPPDREPHNLRDFPTAFEEHEGESLDEKLREEEPEISDDDVDAADEEQRAGRLISPEDDEQGDEIAEDVGPAGYASSAEEAAVHIQDEPE